MAKGREAALEPTGRRGYWQEQIALATKTYGQFHTSGDKVVNRYRIEQANGQLSSSQDKYNMLYSSTETIVPSLYAQTPKPEVKARHRDRQNPVVLLTTNLLESCVSYAIEETDFDEVMQNVVEDFALPGMGNAWVRYEPTFADAKDESGAALYEADGKTPQQVVDFEAIGLDHVNWKDQLYGPCRTWKELPWGARRVYMDKDAVKKRFGDKIAAKLQYTYTKGKNTSNVAVGDDRQAVIWEIWHKASKTVVWYSDDYADDVLDIKQDPLKLKGFFPFPKPLRAISNTKTFVPRAFYTQYQNQQEELDALTQRIRFLTEALQVRGVFDASQAALAALLAPRGGNKMIPIQDWTSFLQGGGLKGAVDFVPITEIAQVLLQLYDARERVKAEIYEITGFGDIMRGASKASETLGAQQIKQDWASARLKKMQREVQRFARDLMRLMGEIISEQFTDETLGIYAGFDAPNDEQLAARYMGAFRAAVAMLRKEKDRCALIDIETDSTILADEANERKDRIEFLGQIGAFLQQAGPMAMQYPDMRGLLGSLMMFAVKTFPSSRAVEVSFEDFQSKMANLPATDPNKKEGDGGAAAAQATVQSATIKAQSEQTIAGMEQQTEQSRMQMEHDREQQRMQNEQTLAMEEQAIKRLELEIKQVELQIRMRELDIAERTAHAQTTLAADAQAHDQEHDRAQFAAGREDAATAAAAEPQIGA